MILALVELLASPVWIPIVLGVYLLACLFGGTSKKK